MRELTIDVLCQSGRILVTICGELGLGTNQALKAALLQAVDSSAQGVDLDLSGATCDCSALNVLIAARRHALDAHKTLTIRSAGSAVRRLLSATGTLPLFTSHDTTRPAHARRPVRPDTESRTQGEHALDNEEEALRSEVVQLRRAMRTRPVIDQARGILMASFGLRAEDAWDVLVSVSQNTNIKLHLVAGELVTTAVQGGALPTPVQQHLAAAVSALAEAVAEVGTVAETVAEAGTVAEDGQPREDAAPFGARSTPEDEGSEFAP
ncbi:MULTISPECIES: ANTAR domain-containing protein [unclassified Streptomyces]|uniref:ANTAR domain-containing protein n=1 Tax=unclassified Streptomyces TaxID=2593676 RepID=UPI0033B57BD8